MEMASYFLKEQKRFKLKPMDFGYLPTPPWMKNDFYANRVPNYDREVMLHGMDNSDFNFAFNIENVTMERANPSYAHWNQYDRRTMNYPEAPQSLDIKLTCPYNPTIYEQLANTMNGGLFLVLSRDRHVEQIVNEHSWFMYSLDVNEREITIELRSREIRHSGSIQRRENRRILDENPWL